MIIIFTGSSGTGKSSLAQAFASYLHVPYTDLGVVLRDRGIGDYNAQFDTLDVDEDDAVSVMKDLLSFHTDIILDSHLSHYLNPSLVDLCIVCTCSPSILRERLIARGYPLSKIQENIDAENFEICLHEAEDMGHMVFILDTSTDSLSESLRKLLKVLS